jgi:hypothetical protein
VPVQITCFLKILPACNQNPPGNIKGLFLSSNQARLGIAITIIPVISVFSLVQQPHSHTVQHLHNSVCCDLSVNAHIHIANKTNLQLLIASPKSGFENIMETIQ